jgi:hypothetical protein
MVYANQSSKGYAVLERDPTGGASTTAACGPPNNHVRAVHAGALRVPRGTAQVERIP